MLTICRRLANGDEVETTIADKQATDVIRRPSIREDLGATIIIFKPRPLSEAELLLEGQRVVEWHPSDL